MTTVIDYSKYFKNYNFINDFSFNNEDYITELLIKNYLTNVYNADTSNRQELLLLKKIDNIMKVYITDNDFYRLVQLRLEEEIKNDIQDLNLILIEVYKLFLNNVSGSIEISRWI